MTRQQLIKSFLAQHKVIVATAMVMGVLNSLLNVVIPLSIGKFYELSLHEGGAKSRLLEKAGLHIVDLSSFFIFFFLLVALRAVFGFVEIYYSEIIEEKFVMNVRQQLFEAQLSHTVKAFHSRPVGKYLLRYSNDLAAIQNYITKGGIKLIADLTFLVFAFLVLASMSKALAAMVAGSFLVAGLIILLLTRLQRRPTELRRNARSALIDFVDTRLNAFDTIKAFNRTVPESGQFRKRNQKLHEAGRKYFFNQAIILSLLPAMFFFTLGLTMWFISQDNSGFTDAAIQSSLLVFILLLLYMQGVFKRLLRVPSLRQRGVLSFHNLLTVMNMQTERTQSTNDVTEKSAGAICLNNVTFGYEEGSVVFTDLSAQFQPHTSTLLSGAPGCGKSTLIKLLLAFYQPKAGSITFDGKEYIELGEHTIRKNLTVISNDFPLLGDTVFKAVSYSRNPEKREKVAKMLQKLGLHFNADMDLNSDFELAPRARNLSASEQKLLQFARALLTEKKVILLDDPFSGLSEEATQRVVGLLNDLRKKRTIIFACNEVPNGLQVDNTIRL